MNCKSCNLNTVESKIKFGLQPPSNRYESPAVQNDVHPLELGICTSCGLMQLIDPMPVDMVRSRYEWIRYNEPEFHLDDLLEQLSALPDITSGSNITGLTYKDESTLARFAKKGFTNLNYTQMPVYQNNPGHFAGLETIQQIVTEGNDFGLDKGIDLLMVRHVLEHAHDLKTFLVNIAKNVKKGGYLVFEIPDSKKFLKHRNYCFIWEEHIVYFTDVTLRYFFERNGFEVVNIFRYEAPLEDSLVALVRNTTQEPATVLPVRGKELVVMDSFVKDFPTVKKIHCEFLEKAKNDGKRAAVFGAGHLAAKYINFFELQDLVYCVIDDSKDKEGLSMPGTSVPIKNSATLAETDICLLALSPESQQKVLSLKRDLIKAGGKFYSIFDNNLNSI